MLRRTFIDPRHSIASVQRVRLADERRTRPMTSVLSVLATLVMTVGFLVAQPAPSHAALNNPIPMNASEEPTYDFVDDDALFVYVTSDIRGGTVCIVAATVENAADGSCDSPAWGTPNYIVGLGSIIQPIEAPSLRPGSWRLLTEDSEGDPVALSATFTVLACADCSREFSTAAVSQWKDAAGRLQTGANLYCNVQEMRAKLDAVKSIGTVKAEWSDAGITLVTMSFSVGGGFAFSLANPFEVTQGKALEILKDLSCAVSNMYGDIVADPPDPNFATVPVPEIGGVDELSSSQTTALARALAGQVGFGAASLTAYERYMGARDAGALQATSIQARAAGELTTELLAEIRETVQALTAFADYADTQPELSGPVAANQSAVDDLAAAYTRIRTGGFSTAERQNLVDLGLDAAEISLFQGNFDRDPSQVTPGITLAEYARALATTFTDALPDLDAFGREAYAIAARLDVDAAAGLAPNAQFNASPASGTAPLDVRFDASGSSDDGTIVSYGWDFGDGSSADGMVVDHTYDVPGFYNPTLTVTDDDGLVTIASSAITVENTVTASFTMTPVGIVPIVAGFDGTLSSSVDGDIVEWLWDFGDGTTGTGRETSHTYAEPSTYTVVLTVRDEAGGTASVSTTASFRTIAEVEVPVCGDQGDGTAVTRCADFTWEPGVETWLVQGSGSVPAVFDFVYRNAGLASGLFAFVVDDADGTIDDVDPEDPDYPARVLDRALTVFEPGTGPESPDVPLSFTGGQRIAFFLSATPLDLLRTLDDPRSSMLSSIRAANVFDLSHSLAFSGPDGVDQFSFEDLGGGGDGDFDDVVFTVSGLRSEVVNQLPSAQSLDAGGRQGEQVSILLAGSDPDGDTLTFDVGEPARGTLSGTAPNLVYTPEDDFVGTDSFTYTVSDGQAVSAPATVTLTIVAAEPVPNRPPVATARSVQTRVNTPVSVLLSATDPDGDELTYVLGEASHGTLTGAGNSWTYTPRAWYVGADSFTFVVNDGQVSSAAATVTVVVSPIIPPVPTDVDPPTPTPPAALASNDDLPATGASSIAGWAELALLLLAVGAAIVVRARRTHRRVLG